MVTQAVDLTDPVLGFFHAWLLEFARHVETVTVICLYEGEHALPSNVTVHSLRKEKRRRSAFSYAYSFKLLAWRLRHQYDTVFVHMNPEYLILAGPMWRMLGKRTSLWYLHKAVSLRLRMGVFFADVVFTATSQSMRLNTKKKRIVGHGIVPGTLAMAPVYPPLALLTIGRLSPVKRVHLLIEAFALLRRDGIEATLTIAGAPASESDIHYEQELREQARGLQVADRMVFLGAVPHTEIGALLAESHLFLHASMTGSLDKASLEPLAAGVPIITTVQELGATPIRAISLSEGTPKAIAGAVRKAIGSRLWDDVSVRNEAHAYVAEQHNLVRLIPRILAIVAA